MQQGVHQMSFWSDTLAEAKARVKEALESGDKIDCPCCGQTVKKYARRIYKTIAVCLHVLSKADDGLEPKEIMRRVAARHPISANEHCKLKMWGLADQGDDRRWRCTQLGHQFLANAARIPKWAYVFDGEVLGFSVETVSIDEIAHEFDLDEILDPINLWR